ncbi:glycosyltransferase family 2 protein [Phormidium sp. FACHB-592]|nr:glycosyltransferase family A protein [Phormidium sp. FACHB-592]MBD2075735.1 glycosyltransferase family 2 protein [Phormidium sp. FACHB-592]
MKPFTSVIIPTHNRVAALKRSLDALKAQSYPLQQIEVIVVADGCTDGTVEMLRSYEAPFALQIVEQSGQGAATARNQGAAHAKGTLLLFLDDDIEPTPYLVEAHASAHQNQLSHVVIGYLPPVLQNQTGFFRAKLRGWWEAMFCPMRQYGHRFSYRNLLSGNFSLQAELFNQVGGFDASFKCHEDYELGVRLIQAGANFTFDENALGYHHEITDLDRSLQRKYQEGKASVQLGRKYPELISTFPVLYLFKSRSPLFQSILLILIFQFPIVSDWIVTSFRGWLNVLEYMRMHGSWHRLLDQLLGYWFMRGVADVLNTQVALAQFLELEPIAATQEEPEIEVDLKEGLVAAEQVLDTYRPTSIRIFYGHQPVGHVPLAPGRERLRGEHLRPFLATTLASSLLSAIALEKATDALGLKDFSAKPVTFSQETVYVN